MSRSDDRVHDKIVEQLNEVCEELGWDDLYLDEYTMAAAVKASAIFQTLGFDYGDRIPNVYKLQDTINDLFLRIGLDIVKNRDNVDFNKVRWSTGMFTVYADFDYEREEWYFDIKFDLIRFSEHRVKS